MFCPTCGTERTFEFRDQRMYFAFLRMPLWPVSEMTTVPRCLGCRNEFYRSDLEKAAVQHHAELGERTRDVMGGFLKFYEFTDESSIRNLAERFNSTDSDSWTRELNKFVARENQADWLIFVSRRSDLLTLERRHEIVNAAVGLRHEGENQADVEHRIRQFANAIGLGQGDIESMLERIR